MSPESKQLLLKEATSSLGELLEKSEAYIMVSIDDNIALSFGGNTDPAAMVTLESIGFPENSGTHIVKAVSKLLTKHTDIAPDRTFVKLYDSPRVMWGWNGKTF